MAAEVKWPIEPSLAVTATDRKTEKSLCLSCDRAMQPDDFMIQCDCCHAWVHGRCCKLRDWQAAEIAHYHCGYCQPKHGPSKKKRRTNWHRHDPVEDNADQKPTQCGTVAFLRNLKKRSHVDAREVAVVMPNALDLTMEKFQEIFSVPIIVESKGGLDMRMPQAEDFSMSSVCQLLGSDQRVDIIDSERQLVFDATVGFLVDYYATAKREKIYNVLSLEFTGTSLEPLIEPPSLARELSWLPTVWPAPLSSTANNNPVAMPSVPRTERFLLLSAAGSYTDFHIDFGGSSVWYHILKGQKIFYIAPPTAANLTAYENWNLASDRVERFLGDELEVCYRLVMAAGKTLFLPAGWIHSVVTPTDSIVFGGNFLAYLDVPRQISIFELELRTNTEPKYLFPEYITVNFLAARQLAESLSEACDDCDTLTSLSPKTHRRHRRSKSGKLPPYMLTAATTLLDALRRWQDDPKLLALVALSTAECTDIITELSRAVRLVERHRLIAPSPQSKLSTPRKKFKVECLDLDDTTDNSEDKERPASIVKLYEVKSCSTTSGLKLRLSLGPRLTSESTSSNGTASQNLIPCSSFDHHTL